MSLETLLLAVSSLVITVAAGFLFEGVDRKMFARTQNRVGPPLLQPLFDALKLLFSKETLIPENASAFIFQLAPYVSLAAVATSVLFIPLGGIAPLPLTGDLIVVLYVLALSTIALVLGASASGSPFSAVGVSRELTLFISAELPLVLAVLAPAFAANTFSLSFIAASSGVILPLAAIAFFFAVLAELGKAPFDISEAEQEIAEGVYAEYSGRLLGAFKIACAMKHYVYASLFVVLFVPIPPGLEFGVKVAIQLLAALIFTCIIPIARSASARFHLHRASRFYLSWITLIALIQLALVFLWH